MASIVACGGKKALPEAYARVAPLGVEIVAGSPEELQRRAVTEREYWAGRIKSMGIKLD